jgi:hypothetical protein
MARTTKKMRAQEELRPMIPDSKIQWERLFREHATGFTPAEKLVIWTLQSYADLRTCDRAHPGNERLAAEAEVSEATVKRALEKGRRKLWIFQTLDGRTAPKRKWAAEYGLSIPSSVLPVAQDGDTDHSSPVSHDEDHSSPVSHGSSDHSSIEPDHSSNGTDHSSPVSPHLLSSSSTPIQRRNSSKPSTELERHEESASSLSEEEEEEDEEDFDSFNTYVLGRKPKTGKRYFRKFNGRGSIGPGEKIVTVTPTQGMKMWGPGVSHDDRLEFLTDLVNGIDPAELVPAREPEPKPEPEELPAWYLYSKFSGDYLKKICRKQEKPRRFPRGYDRCSSEWVTKSEHECRRAAQSPEPGTVPEPEPEPETSPPSAEATEPGDSEPEAGDSEDNLELVDPCPECGDEYGLHRVHKRGCAWSSKLHSEPKWYSWTRASVDSAWSFSGETSMRNYEPQKKSWNQKWLGRAEHHRKLDSLAEDKAVAEVAGS